MIGQRNILQARILAKHRADRISIAAPGDFRLGSAVPLDPETAARMRLLPYCLDFVRRRSLYVGGIDVREAQEAPFYYLHLRRNARAVVTFPWEQPMGKLDAKRVPVFLFSPGRCGSTLLSQILVAADIANVSEPDFYTQATSQLASSSFNPLRAGMRDAVLKMGSDLCAALSDRGPVVAKLRAESCRAPGLLIDQREGRTLFMIRQFESWARSTGRTFRNGPRKMVAKYLTALTCYDYLRRNSDCHLILFEDLMADPNRCCIELGRFLQVEITPPALASAMKKDSQTGTPLAQGKRGDTPLSNERLEKALALWNSDKVKRIRGRIDAASEI